jgi:phosphatidylinositol alpha-mannosyltransferase
VAEPWIGGHFEVIPNGVALPERPPAGDRENHVVFLGRHEPRKGLPVLLRAWPEIHRRTGARLRLMGADPLAVRFLLRRLEVPDAGIDILGVVTAEMRDAELARAKVLVAPAIGSESFGMVLTEAFAAATPVIASDIPGYREVATPDTGLSVPPGDAEALVEASVSLLEDELRRSALGERAREVAEERYAWERIVGRQLEIYAQLTGATVGAEVVAA